MKELQFSGDKSLSHRAAIFAALAKGLSRIVNFLPAGDTLNTLRAMEQMGVKVTGDRLSGTFEVESDGIESFRGKKLEIDAGNSGTGARLLMGLFSGIEGLEVTITGDESLKKRPMGRVTAPLTSFGAQFSPVDRLPITVQGARLLPLIHCEELGSAQVKSALVLAAVASGVPVRLEERVPSRDHTENMLQFAGVDLVKEPLDGGGYLIEMEPPYHFNPGDYQIWGDISSASFFVVLALLHPSMELRIKNVLLNPYRDRYLDVLKQMGGDITVEEKDLQCGEKGGDIIVRSSKLRNITISPADIPSVIDELPVLTIAGLFAEGVMTYRNAAELRVKESDRIHSMVENLSVCGVEVEEYDDGLSLHGDPKRFFKGSEIKSFHDHRVVMSFEVANAISKINGGIPLQIEGSNWVSTSFPDFYQKFSYMLDGEG